jgi:glycosyltransferase involved in cell wall biosynthesis
VRLFATSTESDGDWPTQSHWYWFDMISKKSTVGVIIPLFNKVRQFSRALHSVFGQVKKFDEIIVVDDGSTDGSIELAKDLLRSHPDFAVRLIIHESNRGPGAARNTGLAASTSDFVCFLDADDFFDKEFLKQLAADGEFPEKMALMVYRVREQASGVVRPSMKRLAPFMELVSNTRYKIDFWSRAMLADPLFCSGSNAVLAGPLARRLRFNEKVRNFEDWDYYFCICQTATEEGFGIYLSSIIGLTYSDDDTQSLSRSRVLNKNSLTMPPSVSNSRLPSEIRRFTAGIWLCHVTQRSSLIQGTRIIWNLAKTHSAMRPSAGHFLSASLGLIVGASNWQRLSKMRKRLYY